MTVRGMLSSSAPVASSPDPPHVAMSPAATTTGSPEPRARPTPLSAAGKPLYSASPNARQTSASAPSASATASEHRIAPPLLPNRPMPANDTRGLPVGRDTLALGGNEVTS